MVFFYSHTKEKRAKNEIMETTLSEISFDKQKKRLKIYHTHTIPFNKKTRKGMNEKKNKHKKTHYFWSCFLCNLSEDLLIGVSEFLLAVEVVRTGDFPRALLIS